MNKEHEVYTTAVQGDLPCVYMPVEMRAALSHEFSEYNFKSQW
jgi:hypothetical protein